MTNLRDYGNHSSLVREVGEAFSRESSSRWRSAVGHCTRAARDMEPGGWISNIAKSQKKPKDEFEEQTLLAMWTARLDVGRIKCTAAASSPNADHLAAPTRNASEKTNTLGESVAWR